MGKNGYDSSRRSQDMMAGKVDRAIKKERQLRREGKYEFISEKEKLKKQFDLIEKKSEFSIVYPTFAIWEHKLKSEINLDVILKEISEFTDHKGIKAYQWIKSLYQNSITPKMAVLEIKKLLNW